MISETGWTTFHIGLIVTGNVEEQSIAKPLNRLFSKLCDEQDPPRCNVVFQVIRKIGQLTPRSKGHVSRELFMPGPGRKRIPTKDEELISLPARAFLSKRSGLGVESFVILLDDLERRELGQAFKRYREAFDVPNPNARDQFCVHFLVNMVEAYFLADPNHQSELRSRIPLEKLEPEADVETIPHPKNLLKNHIPEYDDVEDARRLLADLDLSLVLSKNETCLHLRSMVRWCVVRCRLETTENHCRLNDGEYNHLLYRQSPNN